MQKGTTEAGEKTVTEVTLEIGGSSEGEEVVIGYRVDGELHELARIGPPVKATLERK